MTVTRALLQGSNITHTEYFVHADDLFDMVRQHTNRFADARQYKRYVYGRRVRHDELVTERFGIDVAQQREEKHATRADIHLASVIDQLGELGIN